MIGLRPFKHYFDFSGRSGRAEYWQFLTLYTLALGIAVYFDFMRGGEQRRAALTIIVIAICAIPLYAVTFRRLHDRGISGWWIGGTCLANIAGPLARWQAGRVSDPQIAQLLQNLALVALAVLGVISLFLLIEVLRAGQPSTNRYGLPFTPEADELVPPHPAVRNQPSEEPSPGTIPANPTATASALDQLERLAKLRAEGLLTEEEYSAGKAAYLAQL